LNFGHLDLGFICFLKFDFCYFLTCSSQGIHAVEAFFASRKDRERQRKARNSLSDLSVIRFAHFA